MKLTIKLSDDEHKWLTKYDENFHTALTKIKMSCTSYEDKITQQKKLMDEIIAKLDDISSQIDSLKSY